MYTLSTIADPFSARADQPGRRADHRDPPAVQLGGRGIQSITTIIQGDFETRGGWRGGGGGGGRRAGGADWPDEAGDGGGRGTTEGGAQRARAAELAKELAVSN
eukprot:SAG22_NODE_11244_length_494_cov_0.777215_1_plen_104_part_00